LRSRANPRYILDRRAGTLDITALVREDATGHHHLTNNVGIVNLGQDRGGLFEESQRLFLVPLPPSQMRRGVKDSRSQPRRVFRTGFERDLHPSLGFLQLPLVEPPVEGQWACEPRHGLAIATLG
jgi:hypothetical protein